MTNGPATPPLKTALVMVFAESKNFAPEVLAESCDHDLHLWLVDDGADDGTLSRLKALTAARPGLCHLVHLPKRQGHAEALRQGMYAATALPYAYVGAWDAKLGVPLEHARQFASQLDRDPTLQGVRGARRKKLRRSLLQRPRQYITERAIAASLATLLQLPPTDLHAQAQLYRCTPQLQGALQAPIPAHFDATLLARLALANRQQDQATNIVHMPLDRWHHTAPYALPLLPSLRAATSILGIAHQRFWG